MVSGVNTLKIAECNPVGAHIQGLFNYKLKTDFRYRSGWYKIFIFGEFITGHMCNGLN